MNDLSQIQTDTLKLSAPVPLSAHPASVYLMGLSQGSQRAMRQALDAIAAMLTSGECDALTLNWSQLTYQHTAAVRGILVHKYAPATAAKMLCALRRVLQEAWRLGQMTIENFKRAVDLPAIEVPAKLLKGRALNEEEIAALMQACFEDDSPQSIRDRATLAILRGCGVRREELVELRLENYNPHTGAIAVIEGKRGKDRLVYLPADAVELVEAWLNLRGRMPGPLLCPVIKGGRVALRQLTPDAVYKILRRRAEQAGIEAFSPHDLRRTFCTDLLAAGIDVLTVQKLAGHSSPTTTARYDRRGEETKRAAVQRLKIPRPQT